jgi:hypothetical protein
MSLRVSPGALVIALLALAILGCGGGPKPPSNAELYNRPHWQDAIESPELYAVLRPQALRRDPVYGPLLQRISQLAAARSPAVAATRALEAFEYSDEVIISQRRTLSGEELVIVVRGVRADIDPGKLVDSENTPLWRRSEAHAGVDELLRDEPRVSASLFVLPERTWVIATGDARARAREAFAHPLGRPTLEVDDDALAFVRIDGPALVRRVPSLKNSRTLGGLATKLRYFSLALKSGKVGTVDANLGYGDEDSAAWAEAQVGEVIQAVHRHEEAAAKLAWLDGATVDRRARIVILTAPLPARLLAELTRAGAAPLDE